MLVDMTLLQRILATVALSIGLLNGAAAQEFPVEVEMVPPSDLKVVVVVPEAKVESKESGWMAPQRTCDLCEQKIGPSGCGCELPLTQDGAERLLAHLVEVFGRSVGERLSLKRPLKVEAVSSAQLRRLGGERLLGLYQDGVIYLSLDLSTREAFAVLAHEYGHAWLFQHRGDIDAPSELLFEGFAEFFSYLAASAVGDHRTATNIAQFDTSIYGRGARKLLVVYKRAGLDEVLRVALESRG